MKKIDQFSLWMKPVKTMNYPTPSIICFSKKIKRRLKIDDFNLILIRKQIGYPLPKFTMFTGFTRQFWLFLSKNGEKVVENTLFLIKKRLISISTDEYCEYLCICSGSKDVFCLGIKNRFVNFGELERFLKFTGKRRPGTGDGRREMGVDVCIK